MKDLHPTARAILDAGRRGEGPLSDETRDRVHKSVLRRAGAFGAALATTTSATAAAKAGAVAKIVVAALISAGVIGTVAGAALVVARTPPRQDPRMAREMPLAVHVPLVPEVEGSDHSLVRALGDATALPAPPLPLSLSLQARPNASVRRPTPLSASPGPSWQLPAPHDDPPARDGPGPLPSPIPATGGSSERAGAAGSGLNVDGPPLSTAPLDHSADRLTAALALLREVHAALRAGQTRKALTLVEVSPALAEGPLAEEAQMARITALCRLGRDRDAGVAIDRFVTLWPSSPVTARLRGGCDALGRGHGAAAQ